MAPRLTPDSPTGRNRQALVVVTVHILLYFLRVFDRTQIDTETQFFSGTRPQIVGPLGLDAFHLTDKRL